VKMLPLQQDRILARSKLKLEDYTFVAELEGTRIYGRDFLLLEDGCWLNDAVIDFVMSHLNRVGGTLFASVFVMSKIFPCGRNDLPYNFEVMNATMRTHDIYEMSSVIFLPANVNESHWINFVVNKSYRTVTCEDSLLSSDNAARGEAIIRWLNDEEEYFGLPQVAWILVSRQDVAQQTNGYDCGVFVLARAMALAVGDVNPSFNQTDMKQIRDYVAHQILMSGPLGDSLRLDDDDDGDLDGDGDGDDAPPEKSGICGECQSPVLKGVQQACTICFALVHTKCRASEKTYCFSHDKHSEDECLGIGVAVGEVCLPPFEGFSVEVAIESSIESPVQVGVCRACGCMPGLIVVNMTMELSPGQRTLFIDVVNSTSMEMRIKSDADVCYIYQLLSEGKFLTSTEFRDKAASHARRLTLSNKKDFNFIVETLDHHLESSMTAESFYPS